MQLLALSTVLVLSVVVHSTKSADVVNESMNGTVQDDDANGRYKIVCYFTQWSRYRPGIGKFTPENIDPYLCTHIIFAFAKIENNQIVPSERSDIHLYKQINNFKRRNPRLKTLVAVGGATAGSAQFNQIASNPSALRKFVSSVIRFLRFYRFDGLDIDWEYPSSYEEKRKLTILMQEHRKAFDAERRSPRLLLSVAVAAGEEKTDRGFDVPALSRFVDFFNVMAYDYHGSWEPRTGHNAPLYPLSSDSEYSKKLTVDYTAAMWARKGAPRNKLVIGMATYGHSFTLNNPANSRVGAPARIGHAGQYTRQAGFLAYYEVCQMLRGGGKYIWNNEMMVPYVVKGNQWVGYDDVRSIQGKMRWLKQRGYAGAMVWSLDMDDFTGAMCGSGKYPLIKAMKRELNSD